MRPLFSLVKKELLYMRAYPLDLFNYAISPALLVAPYLLVAKLFGFGQELLDSVAIGLILWYWLSILMWEVGAGVMEEMEEGVWESLLISPVSIPAILGAKALSAVLLNLYITGGMVGWFFSLRGFVAHPLAAIPGDIDPGRDGHHRVHAGPRRVDPAI